MNNGVIFWYHSYLQKVTKVLKIRLWVQIFRLGIWSARLSLGITLFSYSKAPLKDPLVYIPEQKANPMPYLSIYLFKSTTTNHDFLSAPYLQYLCVT